MKAASMKTQSKFLFINWISWQVATATSDNYNFTSAYILVKLCLAQSTIGGSNNDQFRGTAENLEQKCE